MPYTKADVILQVAKELAIDPATLAEIGMGKLAASYKLEYGLAVDLLKNLCTELQSTGFALNLDEATSKTNKRVLGILVSYFSSSFFCLPSSRSSTFYV